MISPNDILQQEFKKKFNGYDPEEVRSYLSYLADQFERLISEKQKLSEETKMLKAQVRDLIGREELLKNTILSIQQWSEEVKEKAKKEAEIIVKDAEFKADEILHNAREKKRIIETQLEELLREREKILTEIDMWIIRLSKIKDELHSRKEEYEKKVKVL